MGCGSSTTDKDAIKVLSQNQPQVIPDNNA